MTQLDKRPQKTVSGPWVALNATIQGDVTLNSQANIWFGAVLRGDEAPITIGAGTNVQDNAVIHVSKDRPVVLGKHVTVGHSAILHGCTIDNATLIGMGAIVLDGAHVGSNCLIGAGALVPEGTIIPDGHVAFGCPARLIRKLSSEEMADNLSNAIHYIELAASSLPQWQQ
ncbi:MAG TPA: gamma carbonic anhydrase family protein [Candidatus Coprovicinus avistercoris]|uniref:Gamma carbonic anhydrase family protein n=1 Tax=Candidatus Coprovicinus avistercoris TaxID=2840754 RepID=A0A9D1I0C0_9ACTN|nr:gamma carbonic anhydrase family protein [Candidatus Coprovicinus avistercoris]